MPCSRSAKYTKTTSTTTPHANEIFCGISAALLPQRSGGGSTHEPSTTGPPAMKSQPRPAKSTEMDASRPSEDTPAAGNASARKTTGDQASAISNPQESGAAASASAQRGKASRVVGIQHWTLSDYTRVAIELDQDTQYKSQHISDPDRVFFDLLANQTQLLPAGKPLTSMMAY